ncbi:hypothetical protein G6F46_014285 [Rhizopus delemar]|nr:hypothetical protein G6F46_014285 [Rhizopus delemar]
MRLSSCSCQRAAQNYLRHTALAAAITTALRRLRQWFRRRRPGAIQHGQPGGAGPLQRRYPSQWRVRPPRCHRAGAVPHAACGAALRASTAAVGPGPERRRAPGGGKCRYPTVHRSGSAD